MTLEMGKPHQQALAEVEKCAWVCEYYAENAKEQLKSINIKTDAQKSYVAFEAIGIVLAVMPWNFPFWQVFRFAAPNLMAGNVALLKHASNVCGCSLAIEKVFTEAGFPEGVFQSLLISAKKVEQIIENPAVKAVTLTGSTPAGKSVAAKAGACLKKTVLELGGSDPYLILKDADLNLAVKACIAGRMLNGGQSCIAAKRWIVEETCYEEFISLALKEMKQQEDSLLARHELRDELHQQVTESINKGAKCLCGGNIPENNGAYYPATLLTEVKPGMPAYNEELFGPVASVIKVKDEKEAIETANDTVFGLGAAVFTQDLNKGEEIAREKLEAGCCFVNNFVKSDPRLPFGGIKESGYGRELSAFGIQEFVNIKTVYIC